MWPEVEGCEYDWPAIEQRLGLMLCEFATKVIGERVKVNPAAAENAVQYCRYRATGGAFIPERQEHFVDFIYRYCGSVDWVMSGDVTDLIVGYAAYRAGIPKQPYPRQLYEVTDDFLEALA
jgi:hypothetical protein